MASSNKEKALQIFLDNNGEITNRKIADLLGEKEKTISAWKSRGKWKEVLQSGGCSTTANSVVLQEKKCSTTPKKIGPPFGSKNAKGHGAPKGNKNAVGNSGGVGGMPGATNQNFKHGFFSRIFPNDPDTQEIIESIQVKSPIEVLWENIVIQYTAIARAQRIMFVKDQEDLTKVIKSSTSGEKSDSVTYELQFAWDKQAAFITAQSRAMKTLEGLIKQYVDLTGDKGKLEIEKLKADIDRAKSEGDGDTVAQDHAKRVQEAWANR